MYCENIRKLSENLTRLQASYFQLRFQFELYFYIHLIYCRPFTRRLVYASHAVSVWNICLKKV